MLIPPVASAMNKVESGATGVTVGLGTKVGVVGNENVGRGVFVGIALCVSAKTVLTVDMAVSMISASLIVGVDWKPLQDTSITAAEIRRLMFCRRFSFFNSL